MGPEAQGRWALALALIPSICMVVILSGVPRPLPAVVFGLTVVTCPGLVLLRFTPAREIVGRLMVVVVSSIGVNVVVAEAFLLSGNWSPTGTLVAIWVISLGLATWWWRRVGREIGTYPQAPRSRAEGPLSQGR